MTLRELFPPPGFYRIDEAYKRWMELAFGNSQLTYSEIDNARMEFIEGLRQRRASVNVISASGTRYEIPETAWDAKEFPDSLALYKTIPSNAPKPFDSYAGGIIVIENHALDEWAKSRGPAIAPMPPRKISRAEIELAYQGRIKNWPAETKSPTFEQDWEFLKTIKPEFPRDKARELRNKFAPPAWTKPGRNKSRE